MHGKNSGLEQYKRKILGFSDNRQDAALQAGHFNDFVYVSLIRAGFLGALDSVGASGLGSEELGLSQQKALGFDRKEPEIKAEWLLEPSLKGFNFQEAEKTLREVLSYRVWLDLRRGWRYTNPNLEQLGLLKVKYQGLKELASDEELYQNAPDILRNASPAIREKVFIKLFDYLRRGMAIRSHVLDTVEQVSDRSHRHLKSPWGFSIEEQPKRARWLMLNPPVRRENSLNDEDDNYTRWYHKWFGANQEACIAFLVTDVKLLYPLLRRAFQLSRSLPNEPLKEFKKTTSELPRSTEAERLIIQRVGQDIFRGCLLDYWDGKCAVTGLSITALLKASHIKPWKDCDTDAERLDVFNGLLLAPHLDAAFDKGYITFEDNGSITVSSFLDDLALKALGIEKTVKIKGLTAAHGKYLKWHREKQFYEI